MGRDVNSSKKIKGRGELMKLRAHHLICRLGFQGRGYDKRFTKVMAEVLFSFELNPNLKLKIVDTVDILCAACPHRKDKQCYKNQDLEEENKVKELDSIVISKLGLAVNNSYSLTELDQRIKNKFSLKDLANFCSSCQWREYDFCRKGLKELKREL